ncbi:putative amidohydrolase YtcJ [Halorubrum trapanicum]|uniref:Putative amidohydrolase YtcJ n=1 Tax=Halorubrum trapanicum TaxID=29284 RepID=A0A8J7R679_9EURY|nr:putative amidohydrolase YtcJ [Halorubrum trapanicum]
MLDADPFAEPESMADIDVEITVVDGDISYGDPA